MYRTENAADARTGTLLEGTSVMKHTYKKGDKVAVINRTMGGRFVIEGRATVTSLILTTEEHYRVRFDGDRHSVVRFLDPQAQANPQAHVDALNASVAAAISA